MYSIRMHDYRKRYGGLFWEWPYGILQTVHKET